MGSLNNFIENHILILDQTLIYHCDDFEIFLTINPCLDWKFGNLIIVTLRKIID